MSDSNMRLTSPGPTSAPSMIKAVTLWQPWASLCFPSKTGTIWKRHETRSWATSHRGALAIHSAVRKPPEVSPDLDDLLSDEWSPHWGVEMSHGVVLGIVDVVACQPVESIDPDTMDRLCGDWTPGRFAWRLENHRLFATPIPATGKQGLWNWTPQTITDGAESTTERSGAPT